MLRAAETGWRESAVMLLAERPGRPTGDMGAFPPQSEMDDPERDDAFPNHVLSRVRSTLRWLRDDAGLEVLSPAPAASHAEVSLDTLGCALVPPPRFVLSSEEADSAWFSRTSFSTTDGVETFGVVCLDRRLGRIAPVDLRERAPAEARRVLEDNEVREVKTHVLAQDESTVIVAAEGQGHLGPLRHTFCFLTDGEGCPWYLCILAIAAVPREARAAEPGTARATFRATRTRATKKWWRFW